MPGVEEAASGAAGLMKDLSQIFISYGISDANEVTSDGRPEFISHLILTFLCKWESSHCISSVVFSFFFFIHMYM